MTWRPGRQPDDTAGFGRRDRLLLVQRWRLATWRPPSHGLTMSTMSPLLRGEARRSRSGAQPRRSRRALPELCGTYSLRGHARSEAGRPSLPSRLAQGHGGVHLDELHHGGGFDVGEAVNAGHFAGEVLIQRAVVRADQCSEQIGRSGGGGDKGKFGATGQGLSDVSQISGGDRHPQQGLRARPKDVAGDVQVEDEDA